MTARIDAARLAEILAKPGYSVANEDRPHAPAGGSNLTPVWKPREDTMIRDVYAQSQSQQLPLRIFLVAQMIGRSPAAIYCRANELGITFDRGKYPREQPKRRIAKPLLTAEERSKVCSLSAKRWHAIHRHPLLGRPVPQVIRDKISAANLGRKRTPESVAQGLKTMRARYGSAFPPHIKHGSWHAGWRIIGAQRLYARSRWEANYARYLEWLRVHGQILSWEHEPYTFWFEAIKRGIRSYLPDFKVVFSNGRCEWHEVKGWMDPGSLTKLRRMAKYYPAEVIRVIDGDWFKRHQRQMRSLIPDWETNTTRPSLP